jgi:Protein of unknown function (DUF3570)
MRCPKAPGRPRADTTLRRSPSPSPPLVRARTRARALLALALAPTLGAVGCTAARARPGTAELRGFAYADNAGLTVLTAGATVAQPVTRSTTINARAVMDHVRIVPPTPDAPMTSGSNQPTGHAPGGADLLTGASARVVGGAVTDKTRIEGAIGAACEGKALALPIAISGEARVSHELDYGAYAAVLRARAELFQRNLTATGFLSAGHDDVRPAAPPPGQAGLWPASHQRLGAGMTLAQILSPRVILSGGLAGSYQFGVLASPYRRALVRTSLFPEVVPGARARGTAFVALSFDLGLRTAIRLEPGLYADSWGVVGVVPALAILKEVGERGLVTLRYRLYRQAPAWFYRARYDDIQDLMSSDPRLGGVREHAPGVALRVTPLGERGGFGALTMDASYDLSVLTYEGGALATILGHVVSVGAVLTY